MENCIFCKIVSEEIPSYTIYEDDHVKAFLDISQTTRGHTLVVPKKHYSNFLTTPENDLKKVIKVAQSLSISIKEALNCGGINILSNAGQTAGQTVDHFHVHIIPRYSADDPFSISYSNNMSNYTSEDYQKIINQIKKR